MQPHTAWSTGFLTQLLLHHLQNHYPARMKKIDPRSFFSGMEGRESLKDPQALLMDRHAYLPEEVLREVLRTAERVSGRKDIAYQAAVDYFVRSVDGGQNHAPSIFEIIARIFDDVRTVALCSSLWAGAYTTFLRLQAIMKEPSAAELIILSQYPDGFQPLLSMHYMLKGNYEGFVRLYDFVEEARLEEAFLQYRVRDIVSEFEGYTVEEDHELKVVDRPRRQTIAVFRRVQLESEEIPLLQDSLEALTDRRSDSSGAGGGLILHPQQGSSGRSLYRVFTSRVVTSPTRSDTTVHALQVVRGGTLKSGSLTYAFREGALYETPYSRYRFRWQEGRRPPLLKTELEGRIQKMMRLLFDHLLDVKATHQRLLAYATENKALATENVYLRREVNEEWASKALLGESSSMKSVLRLVHQVAPADSSILIMGETGTGKELIARLIHAESSRRDGRFVALNCGAIPEGLLESELFGHEKGAFSGAVSRRLGRFELAHEGTLFLDEIGDIPPAMQVRLLRVLQEQAFERVGGEKTVQVDVRIIAATNQNLHDQVLAGQFRKDLYYRLNVIPIQLPPLRERLEDIPLLAEYFLHRHTVKLRKRLRSLSPEVLIALKGYSWPGNIRELENIMERLVTLAPSDQTVLIPEALPSELRASPPVPSKSSALSASGGGSGGFLMDDWLEQMDWNCLMDLVSSEGSLDSFLRKVEWSVAKRAIRVYGNKSQAARALRRTYRWLRKLEKQMEVPVSD